MTDGPNPRWFHPKPSWLILGLLAVEGLLWLSERFQWFPFNAHKGWTVLIGVAVVGATMLLILLWFGIALLFRLRFQFSIRSILVLTVVVALPCSWMTVEMKAAREQREVAEAIEKFGGSVTYDWEVNASAVFGSYAQPPAPTWLRKLLRDDFFQVPVRLNNNGNTSTDAVLARLAGLTRLQALFLYERRSRMRDWRTLQG